MKPREACRGLPHRLWFLALTAPYSHLLYNLQTSSNIYNAFVQPSTSSTVTPVAMTSEVPRSSRWSPEHREVPGAGGGWPGQSCGGWSDAADHRSSKRAAEDREFFGRKQSWFEAWHCLRHCLAHLADIKTDERFISTAADEEPIWLPGQSLQGREHDLRWLPSTLTPTVHQFLHQYYTCVCVFLCKFSQAYLDAVPPALYVSRV